MHTDWAAVSVAYDEFKRAEAEWHRLRHELMDKVPVPEGETTKAIDEMRAAWRKFDAAIEPFVHRGP